MRVLYLAFLAAALASCSSSETNVTYYESHNSCPMMTIMDSSMLLKGLKYSGDADYDLAKILRIHHAGGIKMEQYEIEKGKNYTMQGIAKSMLSNDLNELKSLDSFLSIYKPQSTNSVLHTEAEKAMDKMQRAADLELIKDDEDQDFGTLVLPHCQSGIDIAEIILYNSKNQMLLGISASIKKRMPLILSNCNNGFWKIEG